MFMSMDLHDMISSWCLAVTYGLILQDTRRQNLTEANFVLWRSLNETGVIWLPMHYFLLMVKSHICHNSAPLLEVKLQTVSGLDFELSSLPEIKSKRAVEFPIHDFHYVLTVACYNSVPCQEQAFEIYVILKLAL